mgnify:CR=1 FL=1
MAHTPPVGLAGHASSSSVPFTSATSGVTTPQLGASGRELPAAPEPTASPASALAAQASHATASGATNTTGEPAAAVGAATGAAAAAATGTSATAGAAGAAGVAASSVPTQAPRSEVPRSSAGGVKRERPAGDFPLAAPAPASRPVRRRRTAPKKKFSAKCVQFMDDVFVLDERPPEEVVQRIARLSSETPSRVRHRLLISRSLCFVVSFMVCVRACVCCDTRRWCGCALCRSAPGSATAAAKSTVR